MYTQPMMAPGTLTTLPEPLTPSAISRMVTIPPLIDMNPPRVVRELRNALMRTLSLGTGLRQAEQPGRPCFQRWKRSRPATQ